MKTPFPHREYRFGDLRFIPDRQLLLHHGRPIPLGSRAMELLHLLVVRAGEVVSKQELKDHVWPGTHLHDSNLKVNISTLRHALPRGAGDPEFIATVPTRGYRFVAPVQTVDVAASHRLDSVRSPSGDLPMISEIVGRRDIIRDLEDKLLACGFVTIVGPAGVGKTTVAVAIAREIGSRYRDGVCFVDLATIDDFALVVPAVGLAVGAAGTGLTGLVDALKGREMLLLLDNCEHVLSAVSTLTEQLRTEVPEIQILATSREAMRSRAETVFRLAPLDCPDADRTITAAEAMGYSSIQLLVKRAEEAHGFRLTDADAPIIAQICRRLDGIALAIELAAPKLADSDPATLLALLEQSFEPLSLGAPYGNPRHQTLLATLAWSYRLLSHDEARLLRLLSVFTGTFAIEDILGVVTEELSADSVAAATDSLVAKSLLAATYHAGGARYRLLDSTRSFASGELHSNKESDSAHARYARYFLRVLERAEAEWAWRGRKDWTAAYANRANDVRKAIDWAFNGHGDPGLGIRLTVAAIPLWDELSTVGESHVRVSRALQMWDESGLDDTVLKMKLTASFGAALNFSDHLGPEADAAWAEGYRLALDLGDVDYQLRTLWGQAVLQSFTGRHRFALETLERFMDLAERENDQSAMPDGRRLALMTRFYLGEILVAEQGLRALAREHSSIAPQSRVARFQVDRLVAIRVSLAKVIWVRGDHRLAMALADSALDRAAELAHRISQSNALAQTALPLALQIGDLDAARRHVATLDYNLSLHETTIWRPVCRFYQGAIASAEGDRHALRDMEIAIDELKQNNFLIRVPMYLAIFAEAALDFEQIDTAGRAIAMAAALLGHQAENWCLPEIYRLRGLLEWRMRQRDEAEAMFLKAATMAEAMGARTLQLRAATDFAALMYERSRLVDTALQLAPVYALFDPDFPSKDITRAGATLRKLSDGAKPG